jgi:uncharacterized protein (DUF58 family)
MSPGRGALLALAAWLLLAAAAAFAPALVPVWGLAGALLLLAVGGDALLVLRAGPFDVERSVASSLPLGVWSPVRLLVTNRGAARADLRVYDHAPPTMDQRALPMAVALAPGEHAEIVYRVNARERGEAEFGRAELVVRSPLRFWLRKRRAGAAERVRVYPNFRELVKYSLLAVERRTPLLGIRRRPRRGEGSDFHQLREYRDGDTLRQIDWKVTARLRKTISREYQDERDQQIVFLLDCGRKMHSRDEELSHFDHALNAVLLLAHVALRQGDAVGLQTFSGERRWLAPRKGTGHLHPIMNAVYDLQTSPRASDYTGAARDLSARLRKRALVVFVSNLRDEDHEELVRAARLLSRTHLVLIASMKERVLAATLEKTVRSADDAVIVAATHQYLANRRRAHDTLRHSGVLALDAEPQQLAVSLVNGYLDIKSGGLL